MIPALLALFLEAAAPVPAPPAPPPESRNGIVPAQPKAELATLFSDEDYPAEAQRNHQNGKTGFRLEIGTDGLVKGCTITSSSGHAVLDSTTCRLLTERARFSPARDLHGTPTTDSVVGRITWRLPEELLTPFKPALTVETMVATSGGALLCSVTTNGEFEEEPRCPERFNAQLIEAARAKGEAVKQTIVTIATPAGEPEPVDNVDHGSRFFAADMVLTVAPDGSIADCRMSADQGREFVVEPLPPGSCPDFRQGARLFEPATGAAANEARRLNVKVRGYRRF